MAYFLTGGTGFIGKHLIDTLLANRRGQIYVLVRKGSEHKFDEVCERAGDKAKRLTAVTGDLTKAKLGIKSKNFKDLKGKIKHFFHVAAIYDLEAGADEQVVVNVEGTRHALDAAAEMDAKCFNHVSSIAVAGMYDGVFREDMFDCGLDLRHPYFRTKFESEALVRREERMPFRVYRPGVVVGHSKTGEIDKIDGPYYFFKLIQKTRRMLPPWMPTIGVEGSRINIVPVDYVVKALDYIAHAKGEDGNTFHLTDPDPQRIGEVLNIFARAGHAPQMALRVDSRMFAFMPSVVRQGLTMLPPVQRIVQGVMKDLGIPMDMLKFLNYPTRFDRREAERVLEGSGITVPRVEDYAPALWDYWERNLDPDLFIDRSLRGRVEGKTIVVTGGSSGIGKAAAKALADAGAKVLIVARGKEKLLETKAEIEASGGHAELYTCDLADMTDCDRLVADVLKDHGAIDFLVNNAGRSIRRSIESSFDRFHDFERTMQLNYFGCLRLIMGFLPSMIEQRSGQIVNISSIGVLSNAPRFSAYVASKAALDAFSRCAASELDDHNVHFTIINMPLVRTPMIAPTKIYNHVPTISPEEAADMISEAIIKRPQRIATRMGIFAQVMHALAPQSMEILMNSAFKLFPDSSAAKGKSGDSQPSSEQIAFASVMRGIHW